MKRALTEKLSIWIVTITGIVGCILTFVLSKDPWYTRFAMYTVDSNIFITIIYIILSILAIKNYDLNKPWVIRMKYIGVCVVTLTFVVFALFLTPVSLITGKSDPFGASSFMLHFVVPPLVLIDYFVFDRHLDLPKHWFIYPIIVPIIYLIVIMIRGAIIDYPHGVAGGTSKYPYFFLDSYYVGWWFEGGDPASGYNIHFGVIPFIFVFVLLFLGISYLVLLIKRKIDIPKEISTNK